MGVAERNFEPFVPAQSDAQLIAALLAGTFLRFASTRELTIFATVLALLALFLLQQATRLKPGRALIVSFFGMLGIVVVSVAWELFDEIYRGVVFLWPAVWTNLVFVYIPAFSILVWRDTSQRRRFRSAFEHYVDPKIIEEVLSNPFGLELGGELRHVSVLFADIVDFTGKTESSSPSELISMINTYMRTMTGVVTKRGGVVDKIIGDSIMAFWGAPLRTKDAAKLAAGCAIEMLNELDILRRNDSRFLDFDIGIGIATGDAVAGNVGGDQRFNYSLIGDTINLAARLESLTRHLNVHILANAATVEEAGPGFAVRNLGLVRVKGKAQAVKVSEIIVNDDDSDASFASQFNAAIAEIERGTLAEARNLLESLLHLRPDDSVTHLYLDHPALCGASDSDDVVLEFATK